MVCSVSAAASKCRDLRHFYKLTKDTLWPGVRMAPTLVEITASSVLLKEGDTQATTPLVSSTDTAAERVNIKQFIAVLEDLNAQFQYKTTDLPANMLDDLSKTKIQESFKLNQVCALDSSSEQNIGVNDNSNHVSDAVSDELSKYTNLVSLNTTNDVQDSSSKEEKSCTVKNTKSLDKRLFNATQRLKRLQARGLSNKLLSYLNKSFSCASAPHIDDTSKYTVSSSISNELCRTTSASENELCRRVAAETRSVVQADSDTDNELELRLSVPLSKGKKKNDRPAPSPSDLLQWKETRSTIGHKLSFLNLKVDHLDKQIESLDRIFADIRASKVAILPENTDPTQTARACEFKRQNAVSPKYIRVTEVCVKNEDHAYACQTAKIMPCQLCSRSSSFNSNIPVNFIAMRLDHCYNSVLSFSNDMCLSLHMTQVVYKNQLDPTVRISKLNKSNRRERDSQGKLKDTASFNKEERGLRSRQNGHSKSLDMGKTHNNSLNISTRRKRKVNDQTTKLRSNTPLSGRSSPVAGSESQKKKKSSTADAYDIDNIVIPYSTAAVTRVERLQCKEIPTPGWRQSLPSYNKTPEKYQRHYLEEHESTDDESMLERHERCEVKEQSRYTTFFENLRPQGRQRQSRTNSECRTPSALSPTRSHLDELTDYGSTSTPVHSPDLSAVAKASRVTSLLNRSQPASANVSIGESSTIEQVHDHERRLNWSRRKFPISESEYRSYRLRDLKSNLHLDTVRTVTSMSRPSPVREISTRTRPTIDSSLSNVSHSLVDTKRNYFISPPSQSPRLNSPLSQSPSPTFSSPSVDGGDTWTVQMADPEMERNKSLVLKLAKK